MWAVLKFKTNSFSILKEDLYKKIGKDFKIYVPKIRIQKYKNNKLISKEINLLGDYLFCYHENLANKKIMETLKFSRGLKYILKGSEVSQEDISSFVKKCKSSECENGFVSKDFFNLEVNREYRFSSGPFTDKIFQIINFQRNRIKILMGNIQTTINKKKFLYIPV